MSNKSCLEVIQEIKESGLSHYKELVSQEFQNKSIIA